MPKRCHKRLPSRAGYCSLCHKDFYPDEIAASLALETLSKNPPRGAVEPVRFYKCPHTPDHRPKFHLTSVAVYEQNREIQHSA